MPPAQEAAAGPTPVDAITHADKRTNLPTADAQDFVAPEVEADAGHATRATRARPAARVEGQGRLDAEDLDVDAPPIYIQEKIDPRVLVENLRQTAKAGEVEPELTLFETFDGLGELDLVEFYRHEANWSNRMILGDSLQVMASLAEREALRGKVQMIYIDPPYGIKFGSNWQVSARKRDVKDGKLEDATREVEQIKAFRDTWELGIHSLPRRTSATGCRSRTGPADRDRERLRPDRRRERPPRAVGDGRGVRQRELRLPDHVRKTTSGARQRDLWRDRRLHRSGTRDRLRAVKYRAALRRHVRTVQALSSGFVSSDGRRRVERLLTSRANSDTPTDRLFAGQT